MFESKEQKKMEIYQIRGEASCLLTKEDSRIGDGLKSEVNKDEVMSGINDLKRWEWYFGNSKKLIAIDRLGGRLKYV